MKKMFQFGMLGMVFLMGGLIQAKGLEIKTISNKPGEDIVFSVKGFGETVELRGIEIERKGSSNYYDYEKMALSYEVLKKKTSIGRVGRTGNPNVGKILFKKILKIRPGQEMIFSAYGIASKGNIIQDDEVLSIVDADTNGKVYIDKEVPLEENIQSIEEHYIKISRIEDNKIRISNFGKNTKIERIIWKMKNENYGSIKLKYEREGKEIITADYGKVFDPSSEEILGLNFPLNLSMEKGEIIDFEILGDGKYMKIGELSLNFILSNADYAYVNGIYKFEMDKMFMSREELKLNIPKVSSYKGWGGYTNMDNKGNGDNKKIRANDLAQIASEKRLKKNLALIQSRKKSTNKKEVKKIVKKENLKNYFLDVDSLHLNKEAINKIKESGIVKGYEDGTFKPNKLINRAEFTKIVIGAKYSEELESCDIKKFGFSDVDENAWFSPFVCVAKEKGIIGGYPDGTFKPSDNIKFTEASKIIAQTFSKPYAGGTSWYEPFIKSLEHDRAIPEDIKGFTHELTRGQMAEMIYRLKWKIRTKKYRTFKNLQEDLQQKILDAR